jgi:hypothetical protein
MKLTAAELVYVHALGLYFTERYDGGGKLVQDFP